MRVRVGMNGRVRLCLSVWVWDRVWMIWLGPVYWGSDIGQWCVIGRAGAELCGISAALLPLRLVLRVRLSLSMFHRALPPVTSRLVLCPPPPLGFRLVLCHSKRCYLLIWLLVGRCGGQCLRRVPADPGARRGLIWYVPARLDHCCGCRPVRVGCSRRGVRFRRTRHSLGHDQIRCLHIHLDRSQRRRRIRYTGYICLLR